jgi:hypothetical protein
VASGSTPWRSEFECVNAKCCAGSRIASMVATGTCQSSNAGNGGDLVRFVRPCWPKRKPSSITAQFGENLMRRPSSRHDHFAQQIEVTSLFVILETTADCRENFEFALVARPAAGGRGSVKGSAHMQWRRGAHPMHVAAGREGGKVGAAECRRPKSEVQIS